MTNKLLSASSINNDSVVNAAGEGLGTIKDLMVDPDDGRVVYPVLSFGGVLGMGDKGPNPISLLIRDGKS